MEWMPFRVLLYKAKIDGKVVDNVIAEWTWFWDYFRRRGLTKKQAAMLFKWSHAELWTLEETDMSFSGTVTDLDADTVEPFYFGTCWTSTMGAVRDPKSNESNGTVCRPADQVLKHPERWSVSDDIWLPKPVYDLLVGWMNYKVVFNKGYDKAAIGSFGTPIRFHDHDKEICSEHTRDDVWMAFRMLMAWHYADPNFKILSKCPVIHSKQISIAKKYLKISKTDVPSPLLHGINLIKSGIKFRDLAA